MVAYCGVDGTAARFQIASKMYNDPMRTRAPHFLCGSFSEDESGISVVTPVPNTPFRMIYSGKQWRDAIPRSPHGQDKRVIEQSDEQPLALCYGNDPNVEGGSDDELASQTSKTKTKSTSQKPEAAEEEGTQSRQKFEKLTPKILSIHRIRWNMNKGSERWLCYGGAAGLVRCQQIDL
uniref:DNA binding protein n=3 Tax=Solanum tuberosum TaxID=4113 RepID=M1AHV3_SOLTU